MKNIEKKSSKNKTESIMIKLSGAALRNETEENSIVTFQKIDGLCKQIKKIFEKYKISIVIGGGNIWRGDFSKNMNIDITHAHYIGMLATIINANLLQAYLKKYGISSIVYSPLKCDVLTEPVNVFECRKKSNDNVLIFSAGTGSPFFTTDTACVLRAIEMNAKKILVGKDGVDGVYSEDPKYKSNAIFFAQITYNELIDKKVEIMDKTAFTLAEANNLEMIVFNMSKPNALINALKNDSKFKKTIIKRSH